MTTIFDAIAILRAKRNDTPVKQYAEAFDFIVSRGYVYDCEFKTHQVFRNKYTGDEIQIPHWVMKLIEGD